METSSSPYNLAMKIREIWMYLMSGIAIGMTLENSNVLCLIGNEVVGQMGEVASW